MPEPFDFLGLVMSAFIYSPDTGKTASFGVRPTGKSNEVHLPYLSQITIKEGVSGIGEVTVSLEPPTFDEALSLLESDFMVIGNTLSVRWGYSRHPSHIAPLTHAMLLAPDINFGADNWSITLKGSSFGFLPTKISSGRVWNHRFDKTKNKPREGLAVKSRNRKDVIEEIAKRYNFEIRWNGEKSFKKSNFSEPVLKVLLDNNDVITQGGLNDWMFIKTMAAKFGCRAFILGGNVLHISDVSKPKDPDITLIYRGQMDLANNVFPIESFDSETTALFLPRRGVSAQFLSPTSPKSKLSKTFNADASTSKAPTVSGKQAAAAPKKGTPGKGLDNSSLPHDAGVSDKDSAADWIPVASREKLVEPKLKNLFNVTAEQHGVSAKVVMPGVPSMLPESYVKVDGVGKYYSVIYRVYDVTHTVGANFATTEAELKPKGFPGNIATWLKQNALKSQIKNPPKTPFTGELVRPVSSDQTVNA